MPLKRRVPKRGFRNPFKIDTAIVNLGQLEVFPPGSEVTPELLLGRGLVRKKGEPIKILAAGSFSKPLTIKAHGFSSKAKEKIESLGGKAELLQEGIRHEAPPEAVGPQAEIGNRE